MEVLERVGTRRTEKTVAAAAAGRRDRSAYAMTEPEVASSDAKNIRTTAVLDGDEWVINGEKYYISGAGDPRCKIMITMVKTSPEAEPSSPAVADTRAYGHARGRHRWPDVRLWRGPCAARPHASSLDGRAGAQRKTYCWVKAVVSKFRSAAGSGTHPSLHARHRQSRGGAGADGQARRYSRIAFGKPIVKLGKNLEVVSRGAHRD